LEGRKEKLTKTEKELAKMYAGQMQVIDSCLFWADIPAAAKSGEDNWRLVVPATRQDMLLREYHDEPGGGHRSYQYTHANLAIRYWWPEMKRDIRRYTESCPKCQEHMRPRGRTPGHLQRMDWNDDNDVWQIDVVKLPKAVTNHEAAVFGVHRRTRFVVAKAVRNKEAETMLKFVHNRIARQFGTPAGLVHDHCVPPTSKRPLREGT